jgi:glyoxylase-like metal-dependent hydrolase (beta-lactamase superfamily II)
VITLALILLSTLRPVTGVSEIAPGIRLLAGVFAPGSQPDGNTVLLEAPAGLVVVDTGRHRGHVERIAEFAKESKQPVVMIVNTHWHLDHVGGNAFLREAFPGVRVLASNAIREARTGFLANYRTQLEGLLKTAPDTKSREEFGAELALIDQGAKLEPDEIVSEAGRRSLGGRDVEIGLERHAVTAGDVWLFEPKSRVLIAGDLVTLPAPFLDTACPARWRESLDRLAAVNFTRLVPGHGQPMSRAGFDTYRKAFGNLLACGSSDRPKADCISGWLQDVATLLPEKEEAFTRSLMDYYVDVLRGDAAQIARRCGK